MAYEDIIYEKNAGVATITINRPEVLNAFRTITIREMIEALEDSWDDTEIGVVVITGAGDRAFCTGGDQKVRGKGGYGGPGVRGREMGLGLDVGRFHGLIRDIPKPVIAAVNGYAIGGGHVLHLMCDLTIASDKAIFGQVGPRVGSFDAGFGTAYLARIVGEKKAREIWYLCLRYSAEEALQMGLINKVVPHDQLMDAVNEWCQIILQRSPFAIQMLKKSFNADSEHIKGFEELAMGSLALYYDTEESLEGRNAFMEKRDPDFSRFRTGGPDAGA